jgi:hypothetical protein
VCGSATGRRGSKEALNGFSLRLHDGIEVLAKQDFLIESIFLLALEPFQ